MSADSALITFTDRTAFESATRDITNVSFDGIVPSDSAQNFESPGGLMTGGFIFRTSGTVPPGFVTVYGAGAAEQSGHFNTGTGAVLVWGPQSQSGTAFLDAWLPPGKTAFATEIWAQQPFVTTVQAIVNSGEATENFDIVTSDRPAPSFFGVTSDANTVLLVRFSVPPGQVGLIVDNVTAGTANDISNPVPEPGSIILLCAGLAGVTLVRRCGMLRK
jgi:hypothetical protein